MNKKIAITGSHGTIGTILVNGLKNVSITSLAKPEIDIRNYQEVAEQIKDHDVVIHLAWDTKRDNYRTHVYNPDNSIMLYNVYQAAVEQKIPRVIMASSVHADSYYQWLKTSLMSPLQIPTPDSLYGAEKVFMESLGRYYATKGLEVICIRFGGVNKENTPHESNILERKVFLSHRDCCDVIQAIIETNRVPNNFALLYAISNNKGRLHDITNPFGWSPINGANEIG